jgi:hypothetical protein
MGGMAFRATSISARMEEHVSITASFAFINMNKNKGSSLVLILFFIANVAKQDLTPCYLKTNRDKINLFYHFIVIVVCPDPYPNKKSPILYSQRTIIQTYSRRPEFSNLLEL